MARAENGLKIFRGAALEFIEDTHIKIDLGVGSPELERVWQGRPPALRPLKSSKAPKKLDAQKAMDLKSAFLRSLGATGQPSVTKKYSLIIPEGS